MERKTISTLKMTDQDIPQTGPNSIPNQKKKKKIYVQWCETFSFRSESIHWIQYYGYDYGDLWCVDAIEMPFVEQEKKCDVKFITIKIFIGILYGSYISIHLQPSMSMMTKWMWARAQLLPLIRYTMHFHVPATFIAMNKMLFLFHFCHFDNILS